MNFSTSENIFDQKVELSTESVSPSPESLIESFGCFGYELKTALADIIDNSITANAKNIWIRHHWDGHCSWISIRDDGSGMTEDQLREAMRPAGKNPVDFRDVDDLGRFGLGLKTASFSQCRILTVRSKTRKTACATRCWNRDVVASSKSWSLIIGNYAHSETALGDFDELESGTIVVWENMTAIVDDRDVDDEHAKNDFLNAMNVCEAHIAMVFHSFMQGQKKIHFYMNGNSIVPWDPFLVSSGARQGAVEHLELKGHEIRVEPFVLPHHSKITPDEHRIAAGPNGWNAHQGFYLYRNNRLIVPGDWLDLGHKAEEHCKLARIRVDIPNSLDEIWKIDVRKSQAEVPLALRRRMKNIATETRRKATEVYRYRGKSVRRESKVKDAGIVWKIRSNRGKFSYRINRDYPVLGNLLESLDADQKKNLKTLLRVIEGTIPVDDIAVRIHQQQDAYEDPFESSSERERYESLALTYHVFRNEGHTHVMAIKLLKQIEPYSQYPELADKLDDEIKRSRQ